MLKKTLANAKVSVPLTTTYEVLITPEIAEEILEKYNSNNRPLSNSLAKMYANEFLRGQWNFNGENIIFTINDDGEPSLASGQHRLRGLVIASETYKKNTEAWPDAVIELNTLVTTGVPSVAVDTIDVGKVRNHTDILFRSPLVDGCIPDEWNKSSAKRSKWCKTLATAARVVWQRQGGKTVSSAEKFNTTEMLTFLEQYHPNLHSYVTMVLNADDGDGGVGGLKKVSFAYTAALCYIACLDAEGVEVEEATDKVEMFLDQLAQNNGLRPGDPAHSLTGYWNSLPPGSKNRDTEVCGPMVKCLNALLAGERTTPGKIKLTKKEMENYKQQPPLLVGWDTACFEYAVECKLSSSTSEDATEPDVEELSEIGTPVEFSNPEKKPRKKKVLSPEEIPEIEYDDSDDFADISHNLLDSEIYED